jgi:hypothetical protein
MINAKWWMRVVGAFYVLQFVAMALVRAPIKAQGPEGALALEAAGDPMARFLVDTWVTFGLEVGAIGVAVLIASRFASDARPVIWTILAIELSRGIIADVYMLARGNKVPVLAVWLVIHTIVIVTGLLALRRPATAAAPSRSARPQAGTA